LSKFIPPLPDDQKTLVLLVAPSGAGKTVRIKTLAATEKDAPMHINMVHIDRDVIASELLEKNGINSRLADPNDRARAADIRNNEAEPAYFERLGQELKKSGTARIVADYPSGNGEAWIAKSISMARAAGWRVEVEGISVDPKESLSRVLSRNADGMAHDKTGAVIQSWQAGFKNWLYTYKRFPGELQAAAKLADKTTLFYNDNKSETLKPVAEWQQAGHQGAGPSVQDKEHYNAFLNLARVNPAKASFTAHVISAAPHTRADGCEWFSYKFGTKISDLFAAGVAQTKLRPPSRS
jgi:hypothetical protein